MALPIQSIPTLYGKVAKDLIKSADEAYKNRGTIDFTAQFAIMKQILKKAKL